MTTITAPTQLVAAHTTPSFGNVFRSEWTKLSSVRSTGWALLILFLVSVGFGTLSCQAANSSWPNMDAQVRRTFDPVGTSLSGLEMAQLVIVVLGALVITSEYSSGSIRTSLAAVPRRMRLLAGKIGVFLVIALVSGLISSFVAFFLGQSLMTHPGMAASITDPGVLRAVIGGGLYLAGSGLFGLAIGLLVRHTAGAITTAVAFQLVLPFMPLVLGKSGKTVDRYLTSNAGKAIYATQQTGSHLTPWVGFGVFCLWFAVPLAIGAYLMQRRDA